jgi:hypothetical protein
MAGGLIEYVLRVKDDATGTLKRTSAGAEEASDKLDGMGRSAEGVEDAAGEADSVMQGLASAVEQFNPAAGAAIRVMGDMAGGLEAVARGGGALFTILGPVTVAVGAMGAAYVLLKKQLDDAAEAQERATEAAERAMDVGRAVEIQKLREAAATGKITEAELERRLAAFTSASLFEDWIEAERQGLQELREEYSKLGGAERLQTLREIQAGAGPAIEMAGSGFDNEIEARQRQIDSLEKLEARMAAQETTIENLGVAQDKYAESIIKTNEARDRGSASGGDTATASEVGAVQGVTAAYDAQAAALQALIDLRADLSAESLTAEQQADTQLRARLRLIEELGRELKDVEGIEERLAEARAMADEEHARALEEMTQAQNDLAVATEQSVSRQQRAIQGLERGVGMAQSGTGGAAGVASAFGPIGAIIGAILGLLEQAGGGDLADKIGESNDNIVQGLKNLPALIGEELPEVFNDFLEEFLVGLTENADDIVTGVVAGTFEATNFLLAELPIALTMALARLFEDMFSGEGFWRGLVGADGKGGGLRGAGNLLTGGLSGLIENIATGGFDKGRMSIDRTGLYLLHKGNQVVSKNGRATQGTGQGGSSVGGGMSITVQGATGFSPEFADRLSDFFREQRARGVVF